MKIELMKDNCRWCELPILRVPWRANQIAHDWEWTWIHKESQITPCNLRKNAEPTNVRFSE
jgi:hypothetical protein